MKITFIGATGTVTGSKYLVEVGKKRLLVDCGLFQGLKELRLRNWAPIPFDVSKLDAVLLTHAHIDHSGYLPLLALQGFKGPIYATKATIELCSILLPDSGHLQEEDAKRANKYGYSRHQPAMPLYTQEDALRVLKQFKAVDRDTQVSVIEGCEARWSRSGHILGASCITLSADGREITFSGDVGRLHDPIMKPPVPLEPTDYLVIESTYGDRLHDTSDPFKTIADIINTTIVRGGSVLIPAFAVGRAQTMLYYIHHLKRRNMIPNIPVYLDSPMAIDATELLMKNSDEHQLAPEECASVCHVAKYLQTKDESMMVDRDKEPKIIISASGMMTGGRVLHHLKAYAPNPLNTILMTGYQAAGTRGARLLNHEPTVKVHGDLIDIKAQVELITNTSAHADYEEILTWLKQMKHAPKQVFITHGEPTASLALKNHIETRLGWRCTIPTYLQKVELS